MVRLGHLLTGSVAVGEDLAQDAFVGMHRAVADPPPLRRAELRRAEPEPPRRRWARTLVPVAMAAAALGVVFAVRGADDRAAVRTENPPVATTGAGTTASTPPAVGDDTVAVGDTAFRAPRQIDGFGPAAVWDERTHDWADGGVTYEVPGPLEGTISGSLSLSVSTDAALHQALVDRDARAVLQVLYQGDLATSFLQAGAWDVLEVDRTSVIPGAGVGRPDRVYDDWLFAAGHDQIVQITSDSLDGSEMLAFIGQVEGPAPD
jgi:hypothetical protein